ncbi:hypothetical protein [Streptomyces sp. EN16]|uniref:hypothetical protein n=1 Tax=Streptomyces sp. EN16 TaxID=212773 RepID=UPI0008516382|nr:hypothetical protein [Streptomyces sp. EN16]
MIRRLLTATLRRLGVPGPARGGTLPPYKPRPGEALVRLSPGRQITDPDEAEALGMTAYARRLRAHPPRKAVEDWGMPDPEGGFHIGFTRVMRRSRRTS